MKKILFAFVLIHSFSIFAHDSTWSLCKTKTVLYGAIEPLLLNQYEHRNSSGDGRDTELTLIFGSHFLNGVFDSTSTSAGLLKLKGKSSRFSGKLSLNDDSTIELKGLLDLSGSKTILNAKFTCELIRD